jgi:hypothetical protein
MCGTVDFEDTAVVFKMADNDQVVSGPDFEVFLFVVRLTADAGVFEKGIVRVVAELDELAQTQIVRLI